MGAGRHVVIRCEQAAGGGLESENSEDVAGDVLPVGLLGLGGPGETYVYAEAVADYHQVGAVADQSAVPAEARVVEVVAVVGTALAVERGGDDVVEPVRFGDR
jgi:hypothetical protein